MNDAEVEDFLAHYGIKGMRWGVRKDRKSSSSSKSSSEKGKSDSGTDLTDEDVKALKSAFPHGADAKLMHEKYGPVGEGEKSFELTSSQKRFLKQAAVAVAVGGALYYANNKLSYMHLPPETRDFFRDQSKFLNKRKISDYSDISDMTLPAGSILKRISMSSETTIRKHGFYAAFDDTDVERYKAVLPVFWKMWGSDATEGHIVNIRADKAVKVASPKTAFDLYKDWKKNSGYSGADKWKSDDKGFFQFANYWASHNDTLDTDVLSFFNHMKSKGFNAVVDVNDAGGLAKTPLRMFDNIGFSIAGNDKLSASAISQARATLERIQHMIETGVIFMDDEVDRFLAHYGIKGMRWGVRRNKTQRRAAKDAKEFANAKMFYGEGAGTRRKLIREKVASNKKRSSEYAKAFDEAYAKQDLGKAGEKAVGERKRKDFSKKNKQRAGAVARRVTGEWGTQAAFIAIAAGGVAYLNSPDGKAKVRQAVNKINSPKARQAQAKGADYLADYLKRNG